MIERSGRLGSLSNIECPIIDALPNVTNALLLLVHHALTVAIGLLSFPLSQVLVSSHLAQIVLYGPLFAVCSRSCGWWHHDLT